MKGIVVESPTEVGQAILDRMQLGKDLLSDEAKQEYAEAAIAGGIAGGGIRGTVDVITGKNKKAEKVRELQEDERMTPSAQQIWQKMSPSMKIKTLRQRVFLF